MRTVFLPSAALGVLGWKWRAIQSHPKAARCPAWWSAAVLWSWMNCLFCHLLCLTFKMMKPREGDPWQDLFKAQPLGAREGWGVQSLAACWGIDQAVSQRPNAESPARREGHAGCAAILVFEALSKTSAVSLHE